MVKAKALASSAERAALFASLDQSHAEHMIFPGEAEDERAPHSWVAQLKGLLASHPSGRATHAGGAVPCLRQT